jgi:hypothetical protein
MKELRNICNDTQHGRYVGIECVYFGTKKTFYDDLAALVDSLYVKFGFTSSHTTSSTTHTRQSHPQSEHLHHIVSLNHSLQVSIITYSNSLSPQPS